MNPGHRLVLKAALLACFALQFAAPARAQITSGGDGALFGSDVAGARAETPFDTSQTTIGPFVADVRTTASITLDSNLFRTPTGERRDVALSVVPSARIAGTLGRAQIVLSARGELRRYARTRSENSETFDTGLAARAAISRRTIVDLRARVARALEARGSGGANTVRASPPEYRLTEATGDIARSFREFTLAATGGYVERRYAPLNGAGGTNLDQSFRDTQTLLIAPRASVELSPALALFASATLTRTRSFDRRPATLRDASGERLLGGVRAEVSRLLIVEAGAGWRTQRYSNPAFRDFSDPTFDVTIDWYPTALASVRLQAGKDVVNSGLPQVAGIARRTIRLNAYYDPLRTVRIGIELQSERDQFREIGLNTTLDTLGVSARLVVSRHAAIGSFVRWQRKGSAGGDAGTFADLVGGVALTGAL